MTLRIIDNPSQFAEGPQILRDLRSLIQSLPAAVRAKTIADIKLVLTGMSQRLSEDFRLQ